VQVILHSDEMRESIMPLHFRSRAVLLPHTRVEDIDIQANGVSIQTNVDYFQAGKVFLSAGAWFSA